MSSLILLAGSSSAITVTCQKLGKSVPRYVGGRTDSNNGAERSTIRGQKKVIPVTTSYVDTATEAAIQAAAFNGAQIPCSGDILGNIQTLCSLDVSSEMMPGLVGFYTMTLTLYEVNASVTLARYSPGDTITGESFTRSTVGYQVDASGVYVSKAINTKRDGHYIGGVRSTLLEDARTNSNLWSRDLTNASWSTSGTGTRSFTAVGLDGTANSACTLTDSDAAAHYQVFRNVTVANDNATHCVRFWVKKDSDQTRFPGFRVQLSGGTTVRRTVDLNTQTGAFTTTTISGTGTSAVLSDPLWWIVEITVTNNTTGNTALQSNIFAAVQTTLGSDNVATQGACVVGQVQVELNSSFGSSPIFTTTVAVTRGADSYSSPFTYPPQEMTVYVKFVEGGTINTGSGARLFGIEPAAITPPFFAVFAVGTYRTHHNNASVAVQSGNVGAPPILGDTVDFVARLFSDGSVDNLQSIGGVSAAGVQTAANAFATAWATGSLLWLNAGGTVAGATGFTAIQSFKILSGARSLSELQAA